MKIRCVTLPATIIRAALAGRVTEIRVPMKPQPAHSCRYEMNGAGDMALHLATGSGGEMLFVPWSASSANHRMPCPLGQPGDRIVVKEAWKSLAYGPGFGAEFHYRADGYDPSDWDQREAHRRIFAPCPDKNDRFRPTSFGTWQSAATMPQWASRLAFTVEAVRVERAHDIGAASAVSCGASELLVADHPLRSKVYEQYGTWTGKSHLDIDGPYAGAVDAFAVLWDSLHSKRFPWSSNPWAWTATVRRA